MAIVVAAVFLTNFWGCVQQQPKPAPIKEHSTDQKKYRPRNKKPALPLKLPVHQKTPPKNKKLVLKKKLDLTAKKTLPQPKKKLSHEKVFMDMKEVDLRLLLRTLAHIADQSMMISKNVQGTASINIKNEPWDKVFQGLLNTYGLTYAWDGNIIRVMDVEDINNEFRFLEAEEKKKNKKKELDQAEDFVTNVIRVNFADVENLKEIFQNLLTSEKEKKLGIIMVDKHTNSLIVQARPRDMKKLLVLAQELDKPTHQIRIEARIVEASGETARELGVEWGGRYSMGIGGTDYWVSPQETSTSEDSNTPISGLIQKMPSVFAQENGLLIGFSAIKGDNKLMLQLSSLETEGKINILSSPSISTLDNQTAIIESGREVPYQTVEDNEVNVEFKKAVLRLEVTPHVIGGKSLKLKIITYKDELDFSNTVEGNPTVLTKRAETTILLKNGQTTVIGGLRKENDNYSQNGVPILKDIPLLGWLFRQESNSNSKEEVLIFITPHILKSDFKYFSEPLSLEPAY